MKLIKVLLFLPFLAFILFNVYAYGNIISYRVLAPSSTAFMRERMNTPSQVHPNIQLDYRWVNYQHISTYLKKALIASEDANFAEHNGFDWNGIRHAIQRNQNSRTIRAGGSTISQQLAKNLFLNEQRNFIRKGEEALLTAMLEAAVNKDRIYEIYLNIVEWGYGIYGAEAAAQRLYKQSAITLNRYQAAEMASRVSAPLYYANNPNDVHLKRKTAIILKRMNSAALPQ